METFIKPSEAGVKRLLNADIIDIKPLGMDLDEELGIAGVDFYEGEQNTEETPDEESDE